MKERAPSFQFYARQFSGDDVVMGMDLEAVGAHILLMCAAAASPERYRIDADEYAMRMRLRNPSAEAWGIIKKQLLRGAWKVSADGNWWIQEGLQRTFQKQKQFSERQSEKANARWGRIDAGEALNSSRSDAALIPENTPKVCSSSSSSSSNKPYAHPSDEHLESRPQKDRLTQTDLVTLANGIYSQYPRKVGKDDALKAITKALGRIATCGATDRHQDFLGDVAAAAEWLLNRVILYRNSPQVSQGLKSVIPYPATWINKGRYEDDEHEWNHVFGGELPRRDNSHDSPPHILPFEKEPMTESQKRRRADARRVQA